MRLQFAQHAGVIVGFDHHRHVAVVLGGGADHRRPADVDVLDAVVVGRALRDGRLERIEIDHQKVDRFDVVRLHRSGVFGVVANREQAAVNLGMKGLHPTVHHLGKTGQVGHVLHGKTGVGQRLAGAARRNQFDAVAGKAPGEVDQSALVGHREQGAGDAAGVCHEWFLVPRTRCSAVRCIADPWPSQFRTL